MACPLHHITSLSIDDDGWIVARKKNDAEPKCQNDNDSQSTEIALIPSCKRLLKEMKLDLSCELFTRKNAHPDSSGADNKEDTPLEELSHAPALPNLIQKVIADVRRLGAPSDADLRRLEKDSGKKGGQENNRRNNRRGRNGKVARLEEQRRLRQKQEQKKLEESQHEQMGQSDKQTPTDGKEKGGEKDVTDDINEGFVVVGAKNDSDPDPDPVEALGIPVEQRLPAVFNTLRILITLIRPMLDHPQRKDLKLKMKNGPSIKKDGRTHRFYLISKHVYSCVSNGCWNEINREYSAKLLNEMKEGLSDDMSKVNGEGQYVLDASDWIASLFNHELYMDHDTLAEKSIGLAANSEVASKLNNALMKRFETDHDQKQHMLQRSIDRLQDKLTSAISRRFNGVRLTVYGSCLSGLALEGSHDVDVSIFIPELNRLKEDFDEGLTTAEDYEKRMRRIIFKVRDSLHYNRSFADLLAVTRARVPVIKGTDISAKNPYTQDGSLSFDLCFLNDIAVVNSSLLREYSLFDSRVRILMLSVKSFAKTGNIASAANGTLSSYSWLNMVVFYLQCIGLIPVLQCPKMMEEHDFKPDLKGNPWHNVNGLETFYLTKDLVAKKSIWKCSTRVKDADISMLLYGFLNFYSNIFPQQTVAASIRFGNCTLQKTSFRQSSKLWRLCMEDPFETCDSHCPHDLGCHVKEDGQKSINEYLVTATKELSELMQLDKVYDDEISVFLSQWIGPVKSSSNRKAEKDSTNAMQSRHRHLNNSKPRNKANNVAARNDHRNGGVKGKHNNVNNSRNQGNVNTLKGAKQDQGNGVSTYMSAKSQMRGGGKGKNAISINKQNMNRQRGRGAKNDRIDAKSAHHDKQMAQPNKPAINKQSFKELPNIENRKQEGSSETSEGKSRKAHSKQKKKDGSNADNAMEKKLDQPLSAKRN